MGESIDDRCAMLATLANLDPQPESVPINALVATPDGHAAGRPPARRPAGAGAHDRDGAHLDAEGRACGCPPGAIALSREAQVLCFLAGANSIFYGEKLLTTGTRTSRPIRRLLRDVGMRATELGGE